MDQETFWTLLKSSAHWELELFIIFLEQVVVGLCLWPLVKYLYRKWSRHHKADDQDIANLQANVANLRQQLGLDPFTNRKKDST